MKKLQVLLLYVFLSTACSQQGVERLSLKLVIDGGILIEEEVVDRKIDVLKEKYSELINASEKACAYSKFLSSQIEIEEIIKPASGQGRRGNKLIENESTKRPALTAALNSQILILKMRVYIVNPTAY